MRGLVAALGLVAGGCGTLPVEGDGVVLLQVVQPASLTLAAAKFPRSRTHADKASQYREIGIVDRQPQRPLTRSPHMPNLVIFTGAGISADSGLSTFRGPDGITIVSPGMCT